MTKQYIIIIYYIIIYSIIYYYYSILYYSWNFIALNLEFYVVIPIYCRTLFALLYVLPFSNRIFRINFISDILPTINPNRYRLKRLNLTQQKPNQTEKLNQTKREQK